MALHSELQIGGAVLGNSHANQSAEPHNNEGVQMNNTNPSTNDAKMSEKDKPSKTIAWWTVLLLVAPLV